MKIEDSLPIFAISAVAKLTNTTERMIREYEKQGLIRPKKVSGRRLFTGYEVSFIKEIKYYLDQRQMTIPGLREFYFRASCWEVKRCNMVKCPAHGVGRRNCWETVQQSKKCNSSMCPSCPVYLVKTTVKADGGGIISALSFQPKKTKQARKKQSEK